MLKDIPATLAEVSVRWEKKRKRVFFVCSAHSVMMNTYSFIYTKNIIFTVIKISLLLPPEKWNIVTLASGGVYINSS